MHLDTQRLETRTCIFPAPDAGLKQHLYIRGGGGERRRSLKDTRANTSRQIQIRKCRLFDSRAQIRFRTAGHTSEPSTKPAPGVYLSAEIRLEVGGGRGRGAPPSPTNGWRNSGTEWFGRGFNSREAPISIQQRRAAAPRRGVSGRKNTKIRPATVWKLVEKEEPLVNGEALLYLGR